MPQQDATAPCCGQQENCNNTDTQQDITEPIHQQHVEAISQDIEDISQEEEVVVKKSVRKKEANLNYLVICHFEIRIIICQ